jgi:hypothetical protein
MQLVHAHQPQTGGTVYCDVAVVAADAHVSANSNPLHLRPVNLCESEYVHSECRRDSKCDSKCIRGSESESTCKHVRASVCV